jgi:hypothetical protein
VLCMIEYTCSDCGRLRVGQFSRCSIAKACSFIPLTYDGKNLSISKFVFPYDRFKEYEVVLKALALTPEDCCVRRLALLRYIEKYYPGPDDLEMDAWAIERADRLLEAVGAHRINRRRVIWRRAEKCLTWIALIGICISKLFQLF